MTWLINYIPEPIRKSVGGFKDKIVSIFKTNTSIQTVYRKEMKLSKPNTQKIRKPFLLKENKKQIKEKIIRNIWTLFYTERENKKTKAIRQK